MRSCFVRFVAVGLVVASVARPAAAWPGTLGRSIGLSGEMAAVPVGTTALEQRSWLAARGEIARQLRDLGYTPEDAETAAGLLTPEDLEVLLANPEMMQAAGDMNSATSAMIWGGLLVAGLIALAAAGDGSIMIN